MSLEEFQLQVSAGDAVIARFPGVILWVEADSPDCAEVRHLVELSRAVSDAANGAAGLSGALSARDLVGAPPFCVITGVDDQLSLSVRGSAEATVRAPSYEIRVGRRPPLALVQKTVRLPVHDVAVGRPPTEAGSANWLDLRRGIVPGGGFLLRVR